MSAVIDGAPEMSAYVCHISGFLPVGHRFAPYVGVRSNSGFGQVFKTTCFLADIKDFAAFNAIYAEYFKGEVPARSCFQVAALPMGGLVEVECIAVK